MVCFSNHEEAQRYLQELQIRLSKFGLEISPEKTRIIKFGRKTWKESQQTQKKPSTFDFLGFTHCLGKGRKGYYKHFVKTSKGKIREGLKNIRIWLKEVIYRRPKKKWWPQLCIRLRGHLNYFGVSGNYESLRLFRHQLERIIFKRLNRRSQRKTFNWGQFREYMKWFPMPKPRISYSLY